MKFMQIPIDPKTPSVQDYLVTAFTSIINFGFKQLNQHFVMSKKKKPPYSLCSFVPHLNVSCSQWSLVFGN